MQSIVPVLLIGFYWYCLLFCFPYRLFIVGTHSIVIEQNCRAYANLFVLLNDLSIAQNLIERSHYELVLFHIISHALMIFWSFCLNPHLLFVWCCECFTYVFMSWSWLRVQINLLFINSFIREKIFRSHSSIFYLFSCPIVMLLFLFNFWCAKFSRLMKLTVFVRWHLLRWISSFPFNSLSF